MNEPKWSIKDKQQIRFLMGEASKWISEWKNLSRDFGEEETGAGFDGKDPIEGFGREALKPNCDIRHNFFAKDIKHHNLTLDTILR
jgi:hypothetical protein